jgi:signal transduction histidine kinase
MSFSLPTPLWNEDERLKALRSYEILDTAEEKDYNDAALLASQICGTPISLVSFMEAERQWFKAKVGTELKETPRDISFCQYALLQPGLFVVPDTTKDERFQNNPLVTGDPHLRFYAGALLETSEGLPLGTMCVLDYQPRELTKEQGLMLQTLARMIMTRLELRHAVREQKRTEASLRSVLAAIPDCVQILDREGRLEWMNENGRVLLEAGDFSSQSGKAWTDFWKDEATHAEAVRAVAAARRGETSRFRGYCPTLQGTPKWWDVMVSPIKDENGDARQILGISRDVTAQRAVEQELIESKAKLTAHAGDLEQHVASRTAELQETIAELEGYSYTISHDLRAPIRAMRSFAECLHEECREITPQGQDYIRRIVSAAGRLDQLIRDVLAYSRLSKAEFKLEELDPNKLLRNLLESDYHHVTGDRIHIKDRLPLLRANEALLYQCFTNLLSNAVKFTAPGQEPEITIFYETKGSRAIISFQDKGIGIEARQVDRIFELFEQLNPRKGGTGVGLAVARRAAERMGGTLSVGSSAPNEGTTFILALKLAL